MIREAWAKVVLSNSSDHSPGRWSDTMYSLPREHESEGGDYSTFMSTLTQMQRERGPGWDPFSGSVARQLPFSSYTSWLLPSFVPTSMQLLLDNCISIDADAN